MIKILRQVANSRNSLRGAAGLLIVTLFLSNFLGAIRNYFLTRSIPVVGGLDIYYAAFRLPDLIFNLLIMGAIFSAFIPVFTAHMEKKDEQTAWHIANSVMTLVVTVLFISLGILFFLMPVVMHLVVPNFSPAERAETVRIARFLLLSPLFFGISYVFGGILNSLHRFVTYSLAPLVYNLAIIAGAAIFAPLFPRGDHHQLTVVAVSVIIGAFLHMLIQLPAVRGAGLRFRWIFDYHHQSVRRIGKLMIPRAIGLGADQMMLVIFTSLASAFAGAVSYFNLANDIQTMPTVVFGTSFATAIFPSLSAAASRNDEARFSYYLTKTANIVISLMIPATIGLILLRVGIVQVLLGFNLEHVIPTANTLAFFAISLVASGLIPLFSRAFYALQNTRTPTIISVISIAVSVIIAVALRSMEAPGLALAFSIGCLINLILLYLPLRRRYPSINERSLLNNFLKVILASFVMALAIQGVKILTEQHMDVTDSKLGMLGQIIIAVVVGGGVYLISAKLLKIKEVRYLWQRDAKD